MKKKTADNVRGGVMLAALIALTIGAILATRHIADGQEIDQPHRATPQPQCVQVWVDDSDEVKSGGTGAFITPLMVVTCNHVVKDRVNDAVEVAFPNQGSIAGRVVKTVKSPDLAFIRLDATPACEPLRLASWLTSPLSVQGYGSGPWKQSWGVLSDTLYDDGYRAVVGVATRSGDSGGPVIDDRGRFAGTLWGCVDDEVYFTPLEEILKHIPEGTVLPPYVIRPDPTPLYGG